MESGGSPQLLHIPKESPVKTAMEVTIYFPRKKSRRMSTTPSEDPDISSESPPRVHNTDIPLHGTDTVGSSKTTMSTSQQFGSQKSNFLPFHLHSCLNAQKRAILRTLRHPTPRVDDSDNLSVNEIASRQLADLIEGTTIRAEGNSCILLGPRGSGKSRVSGFLPLLL